MRIYVSPWGDPSGWSRVNYIEEERKSVESFTALSTYDNYDKILLLVQDSILVPQGYIKSEKKCDEEAKGDRYRNAEIEECIESAKQTVFNPSSYQEWLNSVDNYVRCSLQKANVDTNKVKVIKVPGIGKFSGTFKGGVSVTYNFGVLKTGQNKVTSLPLSYLESLLAYNIYSEIKRLGDVKEVVLDITHGINYFGSLALMVMMDLASILNIKLEVINFIPTEMGKTYTYKKVLSLSNSTFDVNRIEKVKDEPKKALILSLKMGTVLPILYICKSGAGEMIEHEEKKFIENVSIEKGDKPNAFSVVLTKSIDELRESDRAWANLIFDHVCEKVREIEAQDGYYPLKGIQKTVESLSNFLSETAENIINSEVNDIYSIAQKSLSKGEEKMYYCIYPGGRESAEEMLKSEDVTKRNFIAHAGFLKEIIKVKRASEKEVFARYCFEDEKYYEVLKKIYGLDLRKYFANSSN